MHTHKSTTYDLIMESESEDKNRSLLETVIYALFILSAIVSIWQFVVQPIVVPSHTAGFASNQTQCVQGEIYQELDRRTSAGRTGPKYAVFRLDRGHVAAGFAVCPANAGETAGVHFHRRHYLCSRDWRQHRGLQRGQCRCAAASSVPAAARSR